MCSSRKFRKVMALFLAMIMLFGTFATGVSADNTGGQTGEGGTPTWSGEPYTGSWMTTKLSSGVRYSLVKIKKSAVATQIDSFDDYYTIGSIDVLSDDLYTDLYSTYAAYSPYYWITNTKLKYTEESVYGGTGIQYRRLNALDYEVGYMNDSFDFFTDMTTYKWSGTNATGNGRGIITVAQFKAAAEALMTKKYGADDAAEHISALGSCYTNLITNFYDYINTDDALMKSVSASGFSSSGTEVESDAGRYLYEDSELLNALVMVLSCAFCFDGDGTISWPNTWGSGTSENTFNTWFESHVMTADDFIAEDDEYCYRILAEPLVGTFVYQTGGGMYLTTIRDAIALAVCNDSSTPSFDYLGWPNGLRSTMSQFYVPYDIFCVHQTVNEFVDYDKSTYSNMLNADESNKAEALSAAIADWKAANPGYTQAFYTLHDGEYNYFSSMKHHVAFAHIMKAIFGEADDSNATNYGSYSLAILSPFTYIRTTEELGKVTIVKEEDGTGKKLEGATFIIEDEDDSSWGPITKTTDSNGEIVLDIEYDGLTSGHTYLVTESVPPTGYELIDTPQEFTIVEDSDGNLSADPSTLTFEDPAAEGEAHLLIDYNMNGFSATVGTSGGDDGN